MKLLRQLEERTTHVFGARRVIDPERGVRPLQNTHLHFRQHCACPELILHSRYRSVNVSAGKAVQFFVRCCCGSALTDGAGACGSGAICVGGEGWFTCPPKSLFGACCSNRSSFEAWPFLP